MSQRSYDKTPTLYLIPTPIGNMEDITLRAINILKEVEVIFSEDTRVTGKLMKHLNIKKKMISSHEFNEEFTKIEVVNYLKAGHSVGVVTDRGTPMISDPGYRVVRHVIDNGYNVVSLPGATALIPALTVSGLSPAPFVFFGFLNSKKTKKLQEIENLKRLPYTMLFYEAPHRLVETLECLLSVLGNRQISISREITKMYEEVFRGTIEDVIKEVQSVKGEIVITVAGAIEDINFDHLTIVEHINLYIKEGDSEMNAIKKVAKDKKIPKSDVYSEYHKKKGDL